VGLLVVRFRDGLGKKALILITLFRATCWLSPGCYHWSVCWRVGPGWNIRTDVKLVLTHCDTEMMERSIVRNI